MTDKTEQYIQKARQSIEELNKLAEEIKNSTEKDYLADLCLDMNKEIGISLIGCQIKRNEVEKGMDSKLEKYITNPGDPDPSFLNHVRRNIETKLLRLVKHPQFQEARVLDQSVDMKNKLASALIHGKTVYQDYKGVEDMYFGYLIDKDGVRNEEKYNVLSTKDLPSAIHLLPNAGIFRGKAVEILEKDPKKLIYKIQGDKNIYGRPTLAPYRDDIGVVIKGHNFSYNDAILVYQDKNGNIDYRKICSDFEDYRRLGPVTSFHLHSIENNGKKIRVNLAYDLVPNIKLDYDINELGLKDLPITEL